MDEANNHLPHDDNHPFKGLPLQDNAYLVYEQPNVPLRDGAFVIHKTGHVDYLTKQLRFVEQQKFFLSDFQFGLCGKFTSNEASAEEEIAALRGSDKKAEEREWRENHRALVDKQIAKHKADYVNQDKFLKRRPRSAKRRKLDAAEPPKDPNQLNEHPLVEDCLLGIEQSVTNILIRLRDFFARTNKSSEEKERCYLTLCHHRLEAGIKIGNFLLQKEDLPRVATYLTTRLSSYINSGTYLHLDLPLDDSFQVRFLIIGVDRVALRKVGGTYEAARICENIPVAGDGKANAASKAVLDTPVGYRGNNEAFENDCLFVSIVLGIWLNEVSDSRPGALTQQSHQVDTWFRNLDKEMPVRLGKQVSQEIDGICRKLQETRNTPHEMIICDEIAATFNVQIICLSDATPPKVLGMFPRELNFDQPHIYLYLTRTGDSNHIQLIKRIRSFFNKRGFVCFSCNTTVANYSQYRHFCKTIPSCRSCRRYLMTNSTYVNKLTKSLFCDSQLPQDDFCATACTDCNLPIKSKGCQDVHTPRFCKDNYIKCKACGLLMRGKHSSASVKAHQCGADEKLQFCLQCKIYKIPGEMHLCAWSEAQKFDRLENLAFLNVSYSMSQQTCDSCSSALIGGESCQYHPFGPPNSITPAMASVYFEHGYHERFSLSHFYHDSFGQTPVTVSNVFSFKYMPDGMGLRKSISKKKEVFLYKSPKAENVHLSESLAHLRAKSKKSVEEQLIARFVCETYRNYTFVCTERKAIDFLVRAFVANNVIPMVTVQGSQAVLLNVPSLSIKFIYLGKFLQGNASELRKTFHIPEKVLYFPKIPLEERSVDDITCPSFKYYQDITDTKEKEAEKFAFWTEIRHLPFNYLKSLQAVCERDLLIYATSGLQLAKVSMEFQKKCGSHFTSRPHPADTVPIVSAFTFTSPSSFVKHTFRKFALPENTLYIVKDEYGKKKSISKVEHEAVEYLRSKEPNQWETVYSSSKGQRKFYKPGEDREFMIADAYNPSTKTCFMFCGCYFHGHPNCSLTHNHKSKDEDAMKQKYERLHNQLVLLATHCSHQVNRVWLLWECEFKQLKHPTMEHCNVFTQPLMSPFEELRGCNTDLHSFLEGPEFRPYRAMVIRDALRPAICEAYSLKYVKKPGDGKKCHIWDLASLFPFAAITNLLPCGKYVKLLGDQLQVTDLSYDSNFTTMRYKGNDIIAIVHARVHPPSDLLFPFLQTKLSRNTDLETQSKQTSKTEIVVQTLCRSCSEESTQFEGTAVCSHSRDQRSFVGVYTSQELAYAKSLGYEFDFFEMAIYYESGFFLSKFLTLLGFFKLRHCEFPDDVGDAEGRAQHCKDLSEKMRFKELLGFELTPVEIKPDKNMREVYKIFLNHFLGSFAVNQIKKTSVQFFETYEDFLILLNEKEDRIVDIDPVESLLRVTLSNNDPMPSRSSNVTVSCCITAISRIIVHRHMQKLVSLGATILRVSCDSIAFVADEGLELPFTMSEAFGCFKNVYPGEVEGFVQAGTNLVSVLYRDKQGLLQEKVMASGATMSQQNSSVLSHSNFEKMAEKLVRSEIVDFSDQKVQAVRHLNDTKKTTTVQRQHSVFSRNLFARRQILKETPHYSTLPYGWRGSSS